MKKKKVFQAVSLALCLAIGLTACGGGGETSSAPGGKADPSKPFAGKTLRVAVEDGGEYALFYQDLKSEFEEKTGATVVFESMEGVVTELINKSSYFDVLTMDGPKIPEYVSNGYLLPLDDRVKDYDLDDFYPSALNTCKWDGKLYTIPYLVHGPVVYYRTDLFEKAGIDHGPATLEEYLEDAKKTNDPKNGIYGTIIEGKQSATEAVSHLWDKILQQGGGVLDKDGKVIFGSEKTVDAFKYMMSFYDAGCVPPGSSSYDNGDCQNMFLAGQLAIGVNWPYMWSMCKDPKYSKVIGKVAVAPQPVTSACWSWSFGVCAFSKNADLAAEWCKWAGNSDNITKLATTFINPAVRKSSSKKAVESLSDAADKATLEAMNKSLDQAVAPVLNTKITPMRDRMALTLNRICTRTTTDIPGEVAACAEDLKKICGQQ
ncbi:conserved exported protein of unknown function [Ruminococcaceae bacterium BL-6]|nr:conserved exported protein of unknown function [Ruminococcaceae bacterium BL-6]